MQTESQGNPENTSPAVPPPKGGARIRPVIYLLVLVGLSLLTFLIVRNGAGDVIRTMEAAKWGVVAVIVYHFLLLLTDALSWWALFPQKNRPALFALIWMRWIGESVSNLMPVSTIGGEFLRARLAALRGTPTGIAAASVLGDVTVGVTVQGLFTLLGISLLVIETGRTGIIGPVLGGMVIVLLGVGGFYAVQRYGIVKLLSLLVKRLARDPEWSAAIQAKGGSLDASIRAVYSSPRSIALCFACTVASLTSSAVEVWIALHAVGIHVGFDKALILEGMSQGVRGVVFFIPGGLGVQEGGYVIVGKLLGIPGDLALSVSLIRRAREFVLGVPGLISWQLSEGHRLLAKNRALASSETV